MTRTVPIAGKYSVAQRIVYEVVLQANKECINSVRAGVSLTALHSLARRTMRVLIRASGMLADPAREPAEDEIDSLFPHFIGHYVGFDVHDCASLRTDVPLQPGTIITIEPGLYIRPSHTFIKPDFHGIGVRVEDNVVVTADGRCLNLTGDIPKEVHAIEQLMNDRAHGSN